jgi:hypothetical protein
MKACWGSGGIEPCILDLGARWRWVVSFTSRPLLYSQGNSPWYPLDRKLGGPQNRSGRGGEEKNSQPLPRLEPQIMQPVAQRYTIELFWLLFLTVAPRIFSKFKAVAMLKDLKIAKTFTRTSILWDGNCLGKKTLNREQRTFSVRMLIYLLNADSFRNRCVIYWRKQLIKPVEWSLSVEVHSPLR